MNEVSEKLEKLKSESCTKSIRDDLSNGTMIFSEESRRTVYEMGNVQLIELKQTSATFQCSSCLKHVLEGVNMCKFGVCLRPKQSTLDRIREAFAALKNSLFPNQRCHFKRNEKWSQSMAKRSSQSLGCKKRSTETRQVHLFSGPMKKYEACRASLVAIGWTERMSSTWMTSPRLNQLLCTLPTTSTV